MQYDIAVDIVHIDDNMTQLIDFHGLGSTFSDGGMHSNLGFCNLFNKQSEKSRSGKLVVARSHLSIFWSTSNTIPRCFQDPNKKDKF